MSIIKAKVQLIITAWSNGTSRAGFRFHYYPCNKKNNAASLPHNFFMLDVDTYAEVFKFVDPPLHDPCTVAWVAAPHLFKFDSAPGIYDNKDTVGKVSCAVLLPKLLAQPVLCICGTSAGADGQGLWPHAFCCLILCTLTMSSASFMSSWLWAREQSAGSMALLDQKRPQQLELSWHLPVFLRNDTHTHTALITLLVPFIRYV
eukprot:1146738-Pelagomonas_calceolata.AAC.2